MKRVPWTVILVLALAAACKSKDNTNIVVEVWSDLTVPGQLSAIRIDVAGPSASNSEVFSLASGSLPTHMALVPRAAKDARLTVRATGVLGNKDIVWQAVQTTFVPGESKLLKLFLSQECASVGCSPTQSCSSGVCIPIPTVSNLPDYKPKATSTPPDAGVPGTADGGGRATEAGVSQDVRADRSSDTPKPDGPSLQTTDGPSGTGDTGGSADATRDTGEKSDGGGAGGRDGGRTDGSSDPPVVDCAALSNPTNGLVKAPNATVGSAATYSCEPGYALSGSSTRTCQADGTWSGSAPTCTPVDCGALPLPSNGTVSAPATTYGSTATYSCMTTGYLLSGSATRTCQSSGAWSGAAPTCVLSPFGLVCSAAADCPAGATCCDGSKQSCDGTRLPTGDATNAGQLVVSSDGLTVTDTITGLVWQRNGSGERGSCYYNGKPVCNWSQAKDYCAGLTLGGLSGWRLPAIMELLTIVDFTRRAPAIDPTAFPDTPSEMFWSSSSQASESGAWYVEFGEGYADAWTLDKSYRVRCVR